MAHSQFLNNKSVSHKWIGLATIFCCFLVSFQLEQGALRANPQPVLQNIQKTQTNPEQDKTPSKIAAADHDKGRKPSDDAVLTTKEATKAKLASSLLEDVISSFNKIEPSEYRLLVQVEAATLLWKSDRQRALPILKDSVDSLSAMEVEKKDDKTAQKAYDKKMQSIRFKIFLRIAKLDPSLVTKLVRGETNDKKNGTLQWTSEARAVLLVAEDQLADDPQLAVRTAEESLALGQGGFTNFLWKLNAIDGSIADQTVSSLINKYNDPSTSILQLTNVGGFALRPNEPQDIQDQYFLTLLARIRANTGPNASISQLNDGLAGARLGLNSAINFPQWYSQFGDAMAALQTEYAARSLPVPKMPRTIQVSMNDEDDAPQISADDIARRARAVSLISDSHARDLELQQLALGAASRGDVSQAR